MKYVVIGPTWPFRGGISHYTTLLVKHMREAGHIVRFISYLKQYPQFLYPGNTGMDPSPQSSVLKVDCDRILVPWNPITWLKTLRMIKQEQPDVLILQWWTPFWSPFLFFLTRALHRFHRPKIRVIVLYHHVIAPDGGVLDWFLARRILRHADAHIVMSESDYALLRRALPHALIRGATHPPYDVFNVDMPDKLDARRSIGMATEHRVFLFFGFVRKYKGLKFLIDGFALALERGAKASLMIVGEFWEDRKQFDDQIKRLQIGHAVTIFPDYVPNDALASYFAASDVVVMPYLEATQSGVAQLALGFERPMIATSVGGMSDVVLDNINGLIIEPANIVAISRAIETFSQDNSLLETMTLAIRSGQAKVTWAPLVKLIEHLSTQSNDSPKYD